MKNFKSNNDRPREISSKWMEVRTFMIIAISEQTAFKKDFVIDIHIADNKEIGFIQGSVLNNKYCLEISPSLLGEKSDKKLKMMSLNSLGWLSPTAEISNFHKYINKDDIKPELITQKFFEVFVLGFKFKAEEVIL